ncbi:MAG: ATP-dependent RNA helicase HrpA, partial [Gammaproteobacteria bacterium]|nr:ATP-dependent RNA helicase HrpA [Gammaproteobacteria bacterium]
RRAQRETLAPRAGIPPDLPIAAARDDIAAALAVHQVVVICGETGSGKTTQLPKICLALGRGAAGLIGHTQPRRVAARSVATRIAAELGTPLGGAVGYKVRFNEQVGEDCYVKVMTDGILLAEIQRDRDLRAYDTIIIDEAHERSLNIDFLLGYLKRLLGRRRDLKVVVSSATIDTERFAAFFDGAPVVEIAGSTHPVEVRYRPLGTGGEGEADPQQAVVDAVAEVCAEGPGDVLVFLTGEREIRDLSQKLRREHRDAEVLPVYARLPLAQQQRLFEPHARRRLVLATNIAETSLTVPGIRYVIDPGLARIGRYSYRSSVQRLPVEPISRASADQRKGRCGRVGPGVCVRLYEEADYLARPAFTEPEIRRTNLAAVLLEMRALGIRDLADFPFLDPPDRRRVNDGYRLLRELGAIDERDRLTRLGRRLARLPVDPRIGRMILAAEELDCVAEVLVIAAALSVQDPRERPPEAEAAAAVAHQRFRDERSDFMSYLKLWDQVHAQTRGMSAGRLREYCRKRFLSLARLREWQEVHRQLKEIARDLGLRPRRHAATYARIHRALLTGLLRYVGSRSDDRTYVGVRDTVFHVSPLSGQFEADARWIVAAELVETSRLYAHQVARIRPEWIERAAGELVRRKHFDAHWDARRGEVMVFEQTSLFGLTVTPKRRVRFAPVNREEAHSLFIRAALVEERLESKARFLRRNRQLVERLRRFEHKLRRPDAVVGEEDVYRFYVDLVPAHVCDAAAFDAWRRRAERESPELMEMDAAALKRRLPEGIERDYPDHLTVGGEALALGYCFEPGHDTDGVTLEVPLARLARLEPERFEWLVPGLLEDKVVALLRLLPKSTRRELAPLAGTARAFLAEGDAARASLVDALRDHLRETLGVSVPAEAWRWERLAAKLAPHLLMNFRILDESGAVLAEGRDLAAIKRRLVVQGRAPRAVASRHEVEGLRRWEVGTLADLVEDTADGRLIRGVPALEDRGEHVALTLARDADEAAVMHAAGVRRLIRFAAARELRRLERELPGI